MSSTENSSRKILIPLATMAVAATVVVGSGATWTSQSHSSITAASGNIEHANNQDKATLEITNLKPGDVSTGKLTILNDGSIDSKLAVSATAGSAEDTFYKSVGKDGLAGTADDVSDLQLEILRNGTSFYKGNVQNFVGEDFGQAGQIKSGATDTFTFAVTLASGANTASQNKAAGVSFDFVTSPVDGNSAVTNVWK
jgi:spore coat-associated protein N